MRAQKETTETPIARYRYAWSALGLALLLHGALFALLMNEPAPAPEPSPGQRSLEVTLVRAPPSPASSAKVAPSPQVSPVEIPEPEPPSEPPPQAELVPKTVPRIEKRLEPEAVTRTRSKPEAESESRAEYEPRPAAEPEAGPPAAASTPSVDPTTERPSGRDLLAGATASVREQGFAMQPREAPADAPAQRAARERYIADWTRRVEDIGNRVYPAPTHLSGQLQIRVVIRADGQLVRVEVVQSSGHTELDQAALDTVKEAGPYRPFDRGLAGLERLEFTRTWRFGKGNGFGVH